MQALETIRQNLLAELEPIEQEATKLKTRLNELATTKAQLKAALKALEPKKNGKAKASSKAAKPSPKQKDVREVATALVKENSSIDKADLEALVKQKLTDERGFDLKGFEMRWKEVIASGTFSVDADGTVSMAHAKAEPASHTTVTDAAQNEKMPVES